MSVLDRKTPEIFWHDLEGDAVLKAVVSQLGGLTQDVAAQRLALYGPNRLRPPKKQSSWQRFLSQFHNILIYILLGAGVVTAMLGHWVDTSVIFGVVVINAVIGFLQEGKAERAMDAIRRMLSVQAIGFRDGIRCPIPAESLVPGDIVVLQSGDKVPADLRLLKVKELRIEEAALTGESVPVEKHTEPVPESASIGDRKNMAYSGTLVTYGTGTGVVVATGDATEIGRISAMLARVQTLTTPLLRKIGAFGSRLSMAIVTGAVGVFLFGVFFREYDISDMFLASVGLAVAAIPEGLPAIMTITLAIGVQAMARRQAIIRRLPAVETLGSVTVICSDKTGTLTRNEMTVQTLATAAYTLEVSGVGYDPHGGFSLYGNPVVLSDLPDVLELARAGMLCNDADLAHVEGVWRINGDPTEGALVTLARKAALDVRFEQEMCPRTDVIPFESQHRFMSTLHHDHAGHGFIYIKGAPERVLEMCTFQRSLGEDHPLNSRSWHDRIEQMASRGQRVLAVAFASTHHEHRELRFRDVEQGLTMLGLFGIVDPPRAEAIEAVRQCQQAGIRVKMITGDHLVTARTIGLQMHIGDGEQAISGQVLETLSDAELAGVVRDTDIFARTSPEHKLRLVQAIQGGGEVVAMTGDGVNDAPALKRADVGVAMGVKGTEVAKEAAEMVLADDNFASIAHAVEEGRRVYDNIQKSILFILPTNVAEAGVIVSAILLGTMLPITPVQILWVNMITAVTLALALTVEPPESNVMRRPPRNPGEAILSRFLLWRIGFVSILAVAGMFGLFLWERGQGTSIETARTIAVNMLVVFESFYLLNARSFYGSVLSRQGLLGNPYVPLTIGIVLGIQGLFTYTEVMQTLFHTTGLHALAWVRIVGICAVIFFLVELEKYVFRIFLKLRTHDLKI
ncbi:MAG: cation-transporting P-type ATPase [Nitrospirales bacterium]|nr:MAG: cation-transporting P-type ATPase [Nitrospirales bacterium]